MNLDTVYLLHHAAFISLTCLIFCFYCIRSPPAPLSPQSAKSSVVRHVDEISEVEERRDVKLDTVVNMIDSVTDELTAYKEKVGVLYYA